MQFHANALTHRVCKHEKFDVHILSCMERFSQKYMNKSRKRWLKMLCLHVTPMILVMLWNDPNQQPAHSGVAPGEILGEIKRDQIIQPYMANPLMAHHGLLLLCFSSLLFSSLLFASLLFSSLLFSSLLFSSLLFSSLLFSSLLFSSLLFSSWSGSLYCTVRVQ